MTRVDILSYAPYGPRLVSWVSTQVSAPFSRLREKVPEGRMRVSSDGTYWTDIASRHLRPLGEGSNQTQVAHKSMSRGPLLSRIISN